MLQRIRDVTLLLKFIFAPHFKFDLSLIFLATPMETIATILSSDGINVFILAMRLACRLLSHTKFRCWWEYSGKNEMASWVSTSVLIPGKCFPTVEVRSQFRILKINILQHIVLHYAWYELNNIIYPEFSSILRYSFWTDQVIYITGYDVIM